MTKPDISEPKQSDQTPNKRYKDTDKEYTSV